ncbi:MULTISPECIES: TonB-dependent receptor domain-containing protein [Sporomusa]|uniref:TonB-dependent receptor domain-containing protein n=1 Tax=Sporomusa TaxID=2375 RepID=UPI0031598134
MSNSFYRKKLSKRIKLYSAALIISSLYNTSDCLAAMPSVPNEVVNDRNIGANGAPQYTIEAGDIKTTYAGTTETGSNQYRNAIVLKEGATWRPLDAFNNMAVTGSIVMNNHSTIDLAYKYSSANGYTWPDSYAFPNSGGAPARKFTLRNAAIGDDLTFIINLGVNNTKVMTAGKDSIQIDAPTLLDPESDRINIKVEYTLGKLFALGKSSQGDNALGGISSWAEATGAQYSDVVKDVFSITKSNSETLDKFHVTGSVTNQVDGALNKYVISTELVNDSTFAASKSWSVYWEAKRQGYLSQGAYSAANAALSTRNLWRIEDGLFWKRGDDRRFADRSIAQDDFGHSEGAWANTWRGKYSYDGIQGSDFGQTYSGIQVGYDKLRDRELFGGKVYTGLFFSKMTSDADFYAQNTGGADYNSGRGELDSDGLGAYMLWVGNRGHYLDTTLRWSKIGNTYTYTDSFGDSSRKDFTAETYGLGARYGLRIDKGNGWFVEPQVGLSYGVMRSYDFRLANNLKYDQEKMDMLIGRAGLVVGKVFGQGAHKNEAYLKFSANHDFMDGGNAMFYAMQPNSDAVAASQKVDTLAGEDTWYDVTVGSNFKMSGSSDGWLEVNKSFGGKVNTDWQLSGGIAWRWGGPSKARQAGGLSTALSSPFMNAAAMSTTNTVNEDIAAEQGENTQVPAVSGSTQQRTITDHKSGAADTDNSRIVDTNTISHAEAGAAGSTGSPGAAVVLQQDDMGGFTLAPLVVEATRPDWEKKLSPGTVSVIDVPKYEGEHKTLADLLQTVPGVYIDKLSGGGTGHYSTVRIRGSSASQVNIYMDGVLVNTGSEQAVNLENLNIDNVERIEVYRGYIPARFAGAAMGGAINIVTKRPDKIGGKVSYGMRSFNGHKFNVETTSPLGDGSLLLAYNRDQAKGDFKYTRTNHELIRVGTPTGTIETHYPDTRWRMNNGYQNNNLLAKWQDDNWFVKLNYIKNKTHTPGTTNGYLTDIPDNMLPEYIQTTSRALRAGTIDTEKTEVSFGRRQETGNMEWGWKLATTYQDKQAMYLRYDNANKDVAFGTNSFRNNVHNAIVDGTWKMGDNHLFEFLLTASKETMKVNYKSDDEWSTNWGKKFENYFLPKYDMKNYYFQIQDSMKLDSKGSLTFTPLWRGQKSDIGIDVNEGEGWLYSYNLSLKKQFSDKWTAWATYGTYHKIPSWYEVFGDGVNLVSRWHYINSIADWGPDVYAEHGKNWDASVNWHGKLWSSDTDTTFTYFRRNSKNLMTQFFNPLYGAQWYANYGAGKVEGVELSNKMHWKRFDFTLSATWQDSLITKGFKGQNNMGKANFEGQPLPWTPEWTVNARLDYRFPGEKLSVFGEYNWIDELSLYSGTGEKGAYEAMGLINLGLKYNFDKRFKLIAGVNDIANEGPQQIRLSKSEGTKLGNDYNVAYPQQGRTYYMTVEYEF